MANQNVLKITHEDGTTRSVHPSMTAVLEEQGITFAGKLGGSTLSVPSGIYMDIDPALPGTSLLRETLTHGHVDPSTGWLGYETEGLECTVRTDKAGEITYVSGMSVMGRLVTGELAGIGVDLEGDGNTVSVLDSVNDPSATTIEEADPEFADPVEAHLLVSAALQRQFARV
ncbi:MAG: hypothetical protein AAF413_03410 [Patescibacteria group bacterium]